MAQGVWGTTLLATVAEQVRRDEKATAIALWKKAHAVRRRGSAYRPMFTHAFSEFNGTRSMAIRRLLRSCL
jgi:hypothetical protein